MSDDRLAPLRACAAAEGLDAIALVPGANFRRAVGREFHQNERPLVVVVPVEGTPAAVVPALETSAFARLGLEAEVFPWRDEEGYAGAFTRLAAALSGLARGRIGVEGQRMRVFEYLALAAAFPEARIVDAHAAISALRIRKSDAEIALMREAVAISERALAATLDELRLGMTEAEVAGLLMRHLFAEGAEALAFPPIVAAGTNSALPHAKPRRDHAIAAGEALLFDFGARVEGYCADITRTVFLGHVEERDAQFYETVRAANEAGRAAAAPGVPAEAVDAATSAVLRASPFARFMRHKTGHGLGLDVHEAPWIMAGDETPLAPGTVFTVEPGLYDETCLGVRIEDDVLITETGAESLTTFPRGLTVVTAERAKV